MLSLKSVLLALMLLLAAMTSICAWYQWSPQVIQLNVPVAATALGAAALGTGAALAAPPPVDGAEVAAGVAAHAARNPPTPTATPAALAALRNCRLLNSCLASVMLRSFPIHL